MTADKFAISFFALLLSSAGLLAQDKEAKMLMKFSKGDSLTTCNILVTYNDSPAADVNVSLFIHRLFSELPVGRSKATNENGIAGFVLPNDIPAELNGKLTLSARIEDDENFANTEIKGETDWSVKNSGTDNQKTNRTLYASRSNAPVYLIIVSNLIIIGVWGTLIYVVSQVFKIRKLSRHLKASQQTQS